MRWTAVLALLLAVGLTVGCTANESSGGDEASNGDAALSGNGASAESPGSGDDGAEPASGAASLEPSGLLSGEVVVTGTGLEYVDEAVGDGEVASRCDTVAVHYTGTLTDGTTFDSSLDRGEPFRFTVGAGEVIRGWDEGVAGMAEGGTRTLLIPPELGYGSRAQGDIPPDSTLLFDVEMIDVNVREDLPESPAEVDDYVTTDSGLQYAVLAEGEGDTAAPGNFVGVHYAGWLEDGTLFDSSLNPDRCEPIVFPLGQGQVIRGWDEGVTGMQLGEKRQLVIPPELAYGPTGQGPIPPGATLTFDVELVSLR